MAAGRRTNFAHCCRNIPGVTPTTPRTRRTAYPSDQQPCNHTLRIVNKLKPTIGEKRYRMIGYHGFMLGPLTCVVWTCLTARNFLKERGVADLPGLRAMIYHPWNNVPFCTKGSSRNNHASSARPLAKARGSESCSEPRALASGWNGYIITDPIWISPAGAHLGAAAAESKIQPLATLLPDRMGRL